jgi:nitrogen fixation/metabolism regulation signal transduction histidine kinase
MIRRWLKHLGSAAPLLAAALLLLTALFLVGDAERARAEVKLAYPFVFLAAGIALAVLSLAVGIRVGRLLGRLKRGEAGARLSVRLLVLFVGLSLPPVAIVYFFSLKFLHATVESWYDLRVEAALENALALARRELDQRVGAGREDLQHTLSLLDGRDVAALRAALEDSGAAELSLISAERSIVAAADRSGELTLADVPDDALFATLDRSGRVAQIERSGQGFVVRAVQRLPDSPTRYLQAIYDVPEQLGERLSQIEAEYFAYQRLTYLRASIKLSFTIILSLVLLLSVLLAALAALSVAKRVVRPIGDLARATGTVAAGEFTLAEATERNDELGFLVQSFNRMVGELKAADARTRENQQTIEAQRAYLSGMLEGLSAGVVTLDRHGQLKSANHAASAILRVDLKQRLDQPLDVLETDAPALKPWIQLCVRRLESREREWVEEVQIGGDADRQVLACRGTTLAQRDGETHLMVAIDDQTTLNRAQREAAWGEVARRLAHEVKNPLTPIQLAAERLTLKLKPKLDAADADLLGRSAQTIVNQVESLKAMVNAFADYARPQAAQLEPLLLSRILNEAIELQSLRAAHVRITLEVAEPEPKIRGDRHRLGQALANLLGNALEALKDSPDDARIAIDLSERGDMLELSISDTGPGFAAEIFPRLFEPYATTKSKGTGLGLAIVKRTVEEHGGLIRAENLSLHGARVVIRLPVFDHLGTA